MTMAGPHLLSLLMLAAPPAAADTSSAEPAAVPDPGDAPPPSDAAPPADESTPAPTEPTSAESQAAANGWDEPAPEPAAEEPPPAEPGAPPVPTVAPMPPPANPAGAVPPAHVKQPAPPPTGNTGIGLIAAAGAVGGASWLITAGKMGIVANACDSEGDVGETIGGCIGDTLSLLALTPLNWVTNGVMIGLGSAGGATRGRYDAGRYAFGGHPDVNGRLIAGVGGGLLGVGILARGGLWLGLLTSGLRCTADSSSNCVRRKFMAYFGGTQLASTAIAFGGGMLGYGLRYTRYRASAERMYFAPQQVRVTPTFSRTMAGMAVSGRF